jgi:integral membrane protein (TIGR00529 family)
VPALIIILLSFGLILLLMRFKVPLYIAALAAIIFLGLLARQGPVRGLGIAGVQLGATIADPDVISLLIIIVLILLFSTILHLSGRLEFITSAFDRLVRNPRVRLATFPALIGLLPMPGGAYFSAPMVKASAVNLEEQPGQLAAINYWFRHIWEYWWPLYPGVLLASSLAALSLPLIIAVMIPVSAFVVIIGAAMMFRDLKINGGEHIESPRQGESSRGSWWALIASMWPIIAVVVGGVCLEMGRGIYEAHGGVFHQPLPRTIIIAALIITSVLEIILDKVNLQDLLRHLADKRELELAAMVFSVLYYKNMLDQTGMIGESVQELQQWRIPVILVILILPVLIGLITGVTIAAVGVGFPVAFGLASYAGIAPVPLFVVGYTAAMLGVMFSPIHLCLILSVEYFGGTVWPVYRRMFAPMLIFFILTCLLAWGYSLLPWFR